MHDMYVKKKSYHEISVLCASHHYAEYLVPYGLVTKHSVMSCHVMSCVQILSKLYIGAVNFHVFSVWKGALLQK
jgi:hypothetical protein